MALTGTISGGSGISATVKSLKPTAVISPSFQAGTSVNELNDIQNVDTTGVQDNFYLVYDVASLKWKAEALSVSDDSALIKANAAFEHANAAFDTANSALVISDGELDISANVSVTGNIVPATDTEYDLGSSTNRFRDIYLSGSTMNLGGVELKADPVNGSVIFIPKVTGDIPNPTAVIFKTSGQITTANSTGGVISQADLNAANTALGLSPLDVAGLNVQLITGGEF